MPQKYPMYRNYLISKETEKEEYMGHLLYILPPISFIIGIWRIVYAIKHCHDPDFAIQLVLGFFFILASIVFFFHNIVTWEFNVIPPAGY